MKKLTLSSLLIIITLGLSSCSVEEDPILQNDISGNLFEKVSVKRNMDGSYYVDMKLNDGVGVDVANHEKNGTDINFYSAPQDSRRSINESLELGSSGNINLSLNNTISNKRSYITVFDNDIKFNKSASEDHLADYSITDHGDGTYDLDFTVKPNIETEFIYNDDTNTYEIHLEQGSNSQSDYSRTFNRDEGEDLKIAFVNYFDRGSRNSGSTTKKPEVIIGDGSGGN